MKLAPQKILPGLRRASWILALLGPIYLAARFSALRLPAEGCSPLVRYSPGTLLVVDERPSSYRPNDAVFYLDPNGEIRIGLVAEILSTDDGRKYDLRTDAPHCPSPASETYGLFGEDKLRGRVVMALSL